ncbi:MAG: hypothetical protein ACKN9T_03760 [Candidatus Methylumidiphilus sp.]
MVETPACGAKQGGPCGPSAARAPWQRNALTGKLQDAAGDLDAQNTRGKPAKAGKPAGA